MSTVVTLASLFAEHGVPEDVLELLADRPFKVTTVAQFANYFESKADIKTLFTDHNKYKDEGDVITNLKQAWRSAEATNSIQLQRKSQGLPEESLDDPLRPDIQKSLEKTFHAKYGSLVQNNNL